MSDLGELLSACHARTTTIARQGATRPSRPAITFPHRCVAAPLVGCSDLAFRLLVRRHGADLAYTEMLHADRFASDEAYRQQLFFSQLDARDRPLIVQFCANEAAPLVAAAKLVEAHCDGVDLNLGCPQSRAREELYGAFLLDRQHWDRVCGLVRALAEALSVPVCCKIRLMPALAETIELALRLEAAGCQLLAVHGRERGSERRRRQGAADLQAVA